MILLKKACLAVALLFFVCPLVARDLILEFKGAYFMPTDSTFKNIYGKGGALFGPELTVQLSCDSHWYAFASFDYFKKDGNSIGLCTPTQVRLIPLALGLKYFIPYDCMNFYLGLGFQAVDVRTQNCSPFVSTTQSQWGFGGIAKAGVYYYLSHNFLIDFFIDYSFVKVNSINCQCATTLGVVPTKADVSGAIYGAALGYNF